jgi:RNAse (barnase) inhibitor barstar
VHKRLPGDPYGPSSPTAIRELDGRRIRSEEDFYDEFFASMGGLVPDQVDRSLDGLEDALHHLSRPVALVWRDSSLSDAALGEWFRVF